jgi:hypothetical protein
MNWGPLELQVGSKDGPLGAQRSCSYSENSAVEHKVCWDRKGYWRPEWG